MIVSDINEKFNIKIRDLYHDLGNLYKRDRMISNQYSVDIDSIPIVQQRFILIDIYTVLNYRKGLSDNDFFFFKNSTLPISELSRLYLTHNVYNNLDLHNMCYVFYTDHNYPN
jgi:hypothetical protein